MRYHRRMRIPWLPCVLGAAACFGGGGNGGDAGSGLGAGSRGRDASLGPDAMRPAIGADGGDPDAAGGSSPAPIVIARDVYPHRMVSDGNEVFFTDKGFPNGKVQAVSVNGGDVRTVADGLPDPDAIAVDAAFVYWMDFTDDGARVKRQPKGAAGGPGTSIVVPAGTPGIVQQFDWKRGLILAQSSLYFAGLDNPGSGDNGIFRADVGGGSATQIVSFGPVGGNDTDLATHGGSFYWIGPIPSSPDSFALYAAPAIGGGVSMITADIPFSPQPKGGGLAVDGSRYYFTGERGISAGVISGAGEIEVLVPGDRIQTQLVSDGSHVYFGSPTLARVSLAGGPVETLAPVDHFTEGGGGSWAVALDAANVYWTDAMRGLILKLAKGSRAPPIDAGSAWDAGAPDTGTPSDASASPDAASCVPIPGASCTTNADCCPEGGGYCLGTACAVAAPAE